MRDFGDDTFFIKGLDKMIDSVFWDFGVLFEYGVKIVNAEFLRLIWKQGAKNIKILGESKFYNLLIALKLFKLR